VEPQRPSAKFSFQLEQDGEVVFLNSSQNADFFDWNFGDNEISSEKSPRHKYKNNRSFEVKLIASNSTFKDSVSLRVLVNTVSKKDNVFICGDDGTCSLLNAKTGELVWTYKSEQFILSSPTYANGTLIFATTQNDDKHKIIALDYETGLKKWEFLTSNNNSSSPLVFNDKLYYLSWGKLFCIDTATGKQIWVSSSIDFIDSSPTFYDEKVFFLSYRGLEIIDVQNGDKIKNAKVSSNEASHGFKGITGIGTYHSSPLIHKDVCYYIFDNKLNAYDLKTKETKIVTFTNKPGFNASSPTVMNDVLYLTKEDGLFGFNLPELSQKFSVRFASQSVIETSPLALENHAIYTRDGLLYCLSLTTYNPIWSIDGYTFSSANYFDSIVYVATNRELLALSLLTGKTIWKYELKSSILGHLPSPLIVTKEGMAFHTAISGARQ
jgi:outer membrane protein assembly factor BamB